MTTVVLSAGPTSSLPAQPPLERGPGSFYFDNERYAPYSRFDDDQFVDYDDFYYDEYYEANDRPYGYYGIYDNYNEPLGRPYAGYGRPYAPYGVPPSDDYSEGYYDDFGYGGYARYGYGYEGFTYDYYDDLYAGPDVYGDYYDYGVEEDRTGTTQTTGTKKWECLRAGTSKLRDPAPARMPVGLHAALWRPSRRTVGDRSVCRPEWEPVRC